VPDAAFNIFVSSRRRCVAQQIKDRKIRYRGRSEAIHVAALENLD
jgi:hypothetical protein